MRVANFALFAGVALGAAALAAAAGSVGVGSMDSAALAPTAGFAQTFAGSSRADLPADPDLPIRTARYGEEPTAAQMMQVRAVANPTVGQPYANVAAAAPMPVMLAGGPPVKLARVEPSPRPRMTISLAGGRTDDWHAGDVAEERRAQGLMARNRAAPPVGRTDALIDTKALMLRLGPKPSDAKRGRWFLFAAGSGKAYGLNLIRDPMSGWRRAGWSMERLAEFGKIQLGLGWRKGPAQVSVAASRRDIGAYGLSREDTVFGLSFSVKPGK